MLKLMNSNINSPQKPQAEGETEGGDHVKLELEDEEAQEADSAGRRHGGCAVLSCTACTVLYCTLTRHWPAPSFAMRLLLLNGIYTLYFVT